MKNKTIKILGQSIKIVHLPSSVIDTKIDAPGMEVYGAFVASDFTIYISSEIKGDFYRRTVLHEIIHAYLGISGVSNMLKVGSNDNLEESICTLFENLTEVLDNEYIQKIIMK